MVFLNVRDLNTCAPADALFVLDNQPSPFQISTWFSIQSTHFSSPFLKSRSTRKLQASEPTMGEHSWNPFRHKSAKETKSNEPEKQTISTSINAVYYPNWRVYRKQPPSSQNLEFITHIYYAFAR